MYSCTTCGKDFGGRRNLERHNDRQNPCKRPTVVCPDCNKGFANVKTLRQHRCSGSGESRVVAATQPVVSQTDDSQSGDSQSDDDESDDSQSDAEVQAVSVPNTFVWKASENTQKNHSFLLPRDIRGIIVGKSGFGKTTLELHVIGI